MSSFQILTGQTAQTTAAFYADGCDPWWWPIIVTY
jgi:hypothetical protein